MLNIRQKSRRLRDITPRSAVLLVIVLGTLARLVLAGSIGLGVDESYAVSVARTFSLSYFDHPPLHFWLVWLTAHISGSESALVLRLPFIGLFAGTTWLMYKLGCRFFGPWPGVYAAVLLNISAVFSLSTGSWILPDGPLMFLMLAAVLVLGKLLFSRSQQHPWRLWLLAGVLTGLGMLAKYHAIFVFLGGFLFLLTTKDRRRLLLTAGPYLALGSAALVFLPVIIWNAEHGWVSFVFQSGRGAARGFFPLQMLGNLAGQAAWILPWIWLPLAGALLKGVAGGPGDRRKRTLADRQWFLCCLAGGPIILFTLAALWGSQGLFHWQAPGYLLSMPLLGRLIAGWLKSGSTIARIWLRGSTAAFLLLVLVLGIHTATGWMAQAQPHWFEQGDPSAEALDWAELPGYLAEQGLLAKTQFVVATDWIEAGKIDYILGGKLPVVCLSSEPHHFAFLQRLGALRGDNALIITRKPLTELNLSRYQPCFSSIESVGTVTIKRGGRPEFEVVILEATNFTGTFPLPYQL